jgi:hypothetical protein
MAFFNFINKLAKQQEKEKEQRLSPQLRKILFHEPVIRERKTKQNKNACRGRRLIAQKPFPRSIIPQSPRSRTPRSRKGKKHGVEYVMGAQASLDSSPFHLVLPFQPACSLEWCKKWFVPRTIVVFSRKYRRARDPIIKSSLELFSPSVRASREHGERAHSRILKRRGFGDWRISAGPLSLDRVLLVLAETPLQPALLLFRLCACGRRETAPGRRCGRG